MQELPKGFRILRTSSNLISEMTVRERVPFDELKKAQNLPPDGFIIVRLRIRIDERGSFYSNSVLGKYSDISSIRKRVAEIHEADRDWIG
jgi:hypothetical protein